MRTTVAHLLASKGRDVWSVTSTTTVYEALEAMAEKGVGALLVVDDGELTGIISERDYARKVVLLDRVSKRTPVETIMSSELKTVTPDSSVADCMNLMTEHRIRHLPVVDEKGLAGIVSIGDIVKAVINDQAFLIDQLEQYIST